MKKVELEGIVRKKLGTSPSNVLRRAGKVPAVVFGKGIKPVNFEINKKSFLKVISGESGHNVLITLKISDDSKHKTEVVLTQEIQRNPVNGEVLHVDFHKIVLTEKIKTKVPVELTGVPVGVKEDGGILIHGLREIEVKCLPTEIPEKFEIDVSSLKIGDSRQVVDLKPGKDIEILTTQTEMLANVTPPAKEEDLTAPSEVLTPDQVVTEKGGAPEAAEAGAEGGEEKGKAKAEAKAPKAEAKPAAEKESKPAKEEKKK